MYRYLKRVLDFGVAIALLVVLAPVLLLIAGLIKSTSPGPVLYGGRRVGKGGGSFTMLKFRTMVTDAAASGVSSTASDDPRITPMGSVLRATKLDELPQLLNVASGEMSLVGPRPQVQWAVDLYRPEERVVLDVRPGITDFASLKFRDEGAILKGSADPDRDYLAKIAPEKMKLALNYVHSYSFAVDIKILAATAMAVAGLDPEWCLPISVDKSTLKDSASSDRGLVK